MANHVSAEKRHRQSLKRRARNAALRSRMRRVVKDARSAVEAKGSDSAALVKSAVARIYKTAAKGVISKATAARRVSRLMKAAHAAHG